MPVCPVGTNSLRMPRRARLAVELERDGHLPDRAVGADGEDRLVAPCVRFSPVGTLRPARRLAQVAQLDAVLARERGELGIVGDELVQAVLEVEPRRDALLEQLAPRRREPPALRGDADERGRRLEAAARRRRCRRPGSRPRVSPARSRVEQRDDLLRPVAHDAARGLAEVRVAGAALGEDEQPTRARRRAPERLQGAARRPRTRHRATGRRRAAGCRRGRRGRSRLAMCAPAAMPSPDSTMQPSITPSPSARAACAMRTASRIPPDFASLMLIPCARSAQAATSASVWQSSST